MSTRVLIFGIAFAAAALAPLVAAHADSRRGDQRTHEQNNVGEGWHPDPSWNRRFSVTCGSQDGNYRFCQVDLGGAGRASVQRQLSSTRCVKNRNWGSNRAGVWVSKGCRAVFTIDRKWRNGYMNDNAGAGWHPGPSWNRRFAVTCGSQDGNYRFCQVDLGGAGRASVQRQLSSTRCVKNRNWGSNRAGVWVSQGCRAIFSIDRKWR